MNAKLMSLLADATAAAEATAGAEAEMSTGAMIIYYAVQFLPMILIFVIFIIYNNICRKYISFFTFIIYNINFKL